MLGHNLNKKIVQNQDFDVASLIKRLPYKLCNTNINKLNKNFSCLRPEMLTLHINKFGKSSI